MVNPMSSTVDDRDDHHTVRCRVCDWVSYADHGRELSAEWDRRRHDQSVHDIDPEHEQVAEVVAVSEVDR